MSTRATGYCAVLLGDHQRLDALFEELVNASEAGVTRDVIGDLWSRFGDGVHVHFLAEEEHLFPVLAETHPEEARALQEEHDQIRRRLLELDVQVDLHLIRHPTVSEIVHRLREHAAREEQTLYRWADRALGADLLEQLKHRLEMRRALEGEGALFAC
jgi:hemerythrin superfamily protein